jgi:ABC-2 type transport system ATP-binding protein
MDSDAVARYLLTTTAARDVEIVAHNLEDAFLALTSDEPAAAVDERADAQSAA